MSVPFVRYDLAELYLKLKNYEKSDKVIKLALEQEKGAFYVLCSLLHLYISRVKSGLGNTCILTNFYLIFCLPRKSEYTKMIRLLKEITVEF